MFKNAEWIKGFVDGMSAIWPEDDGFTPRIAVGYDESMAGNDDYGEGFNAANDQRQLLDDWTAPLLVKASPPCAQFSPAVALLDIDAQFAKLERVIASIRRYPVNPDAPEEGTDVPIDEVASRLRIPAEVFAPSPPDGGPCVMCHHDASVHWVAATVGVSGCDACTCTAYVAYTQ